MKAKTITQLRKQADVLFSKMVRMRDCDGYGWGECITCGVKKAWKEAHCGHFQSRRFPATRWDEMNCNLQCAGCNLFGAGEQYKHGMAIDAKYGDGTAKALEVKAHTYFKVTRQYLEEVIADAKTEISWYEDNLINKEKK